MATPSTNLYHYSWPYILERENQENCVYVGGYRNEYREILEPVFNSVSIRERYSDIDREREPQDLLILDNPPVLDKEVITNSIRHLNHSGYLALRVDGTNRLSLLSRSFGLHRGQHNTPVRDVFQLLRDNHPDLIARYAVVSSFQRETAFTVDLDSECAIRWLLDLGDEPGANRLIDYTTRIGEYMHEAGLFKYFLPSFVFVYGPTTSTRPTFDVQKSTVNRSTLLQFDSGSIEAIRKIPADVNREFVEREVEVMNAIRSPLNGELKQTIPETEWVRMNGRDVIEERAVSGYTISNHYKRNPDSFSKSVEIPLTWLTDVLAKQVDQRKSIDSEKYEAMLTFGGKTYRVVSNFSGPIDYPVSPCHGDFFGPNILTDGATVTGVIDWEWGSVEGSPVVDALFYLLQLGDTLFDDLSDGIQKTLIDETRYSATVWSALHDLCLAIGCRLRDLIYLLPYPYLRRARIQKQRYGQYEKVWLQKADHAARMGRTILDFNRSPYDL